MIAGTTIEATMIASSATVPEFASGSSGTSCADYAARGRTRSG
jgi:hypothetical protein